MYYGYFDGVITQSARTYLVHLIASVVRSWSVVSRIVVMVTKTASPPQVTDVLARVHLAPFLVKPRVIS